MNTVSKRIEWIDIYKALAIVCMVMGHTTNRFNGYIYQFHIAAFFFVSGCTARLKRKSFVEVTVGRFFMLLLPLVVFIAGGTVLLKLLSFTPYQLFNMPFLGIRGTFRIWLKSGDLYIQFLGATWFLVVLFEVFVFSKILYALTKNFHPAVLAFFSFAFYIIGYVVVLNNRRGGFCLDLPLVAQFYFIAGSFAQRIIEKIDAKNICRLLTLVFTIFLFYVFKNKLHITVDWPSRRFHNILFETLAGLNGITFLYIVSRFLEKIPKTIKTPLILLGRDTMGIVFLHFLFFKLMFCVAYKLDMITLEQMQNVVLPPEFGNKYWPILSLFSIIGSVATWEAIKRIPVVSFLLGFSTRKYKSICKRIESVRMVKSAGALLASRR